MRRPIPSLNMRYLITSLFTVLLLLQHQGKAQPDAYGLSATTSSRKWLTVSQTAGLGAVQNLPVSAAANRYNGQVAQRSQMVRRDDLGNILFFAVDGKLYDGQGYMIADSRGPGCQQCLDPGIMDFISVPVPTRPEGPEYCTLFYLFSAIHDYGTNKTWVQVSVLDLEADNPHHPGRKGSLLKKDQAPFSTEYFPNWFPDDETISPSSLYVGALSINPNAKGVSPIIRVVRSGTASTAHSWLYLALTDFLIPYKITSSGIETVQPISGLSYVPLNSLASPAITKQFVRDADVFRNGGTIHFAMVDNRVFQPYPSYAALGDLITMRFDNASGALVSGSVAIHNVGAVGGGSNPPNGGVGGLSGCVFGTTSNILWLTDNFWNGTSWVPRLATYDITTSTRTDRSSLIPSIGTYVNSRMYRNIAPSGTSQGQAIYFPTATAVGVLRGIGTPASATFSSTGISAPAPVLANVPGAANVYMPRFLNEGVVGENFVSLFASAACCVHRQNLRAVHGFTVSTSNTFAAPWQPGAHPFGTGSTINFSQDLVVPAGKRLYLKDVTLRFAENAKLVIQQGGYVHTRNTRLTAYDCLNARWQGVRILGTINQPQTSDLSPVNHGRMELTSTSTIEYAQIGVQLAADPTVPWYGFYSGGILNSDNSSFLNCKEGVRMLPFLNTQVGNPSVILNNRTSFRKTTFTVNGSYPAPYDFVNHAWLNTVSGIQFNECHFKNERPDASFSSTGSLQLGHGIYSMDAEFKVLSGCAIAPPIGQPCAPANVVRSTFVGLDHGIHALVGTTSRAFEVDRAAFTNNICGVYTLGIVGFKVTNNNFILGNRNVTLNNPEEDPAWFGHHRGVYSSSGHGFTVDDNSFQRQGTRPTEGIVIGYSRGYEDIVFRNTASGMNAAYVGEGVCCDIDQKPLVGLQFRCNQNNGNGFNIWNRVLAATPGNPQQDHTIRTAQGQLDFPAGNTFDRAAGGLPESDLHYNLDLNVTNYIGHMAGSVYDPLDIDATYFPKTIVATAPANVCTQRIPPIVMQMQEGGNGTETLSAAYDSERAAAANLRYVYDNLIDGGSTEALVAEISESWPAEVWELRSSLLAKSPYLSTEALIEVAHKNILPQAVLLEICLANPEATKQDGYLKWLEYESPAPLPAYMLGLIEDSWNTKTFRFTLENQLAGHYTAMDQLVNELVQAHRADTLYEQVENLRSAWRLSHSSASRYAEALTSVQLGDHAGAFAAMERLRIEHKLQPDQEAEVERMHNFVEFLRTVAASNRALSELTEAEVDQLEVTVAVTNDRPGTWARNILCFHYGRCVPPPTGWETNDPKSNRPQPQVEALEKGTALSVYPNPATTAVTFAYRMDAIAEQAYLQVVDASGRQVARISIPAQEGQVAWDPRGLATGAYQVELRNGGKLVQSTTLLVP